jgi:hypothetical protein
MPTLREAYGVLDILNGPNPDAEDRRRRLLAVYYNGTPLGDHVPVMRSSDPGETYYSKEFGEALSFANLAVGAGIDAKIANIVNASPPEPDLIVTMTHGAEVYVEVAQVTEESSARAANTIGAINKHITNRYLTDAAFAKASKGKFIDFKFPTVPKSSETMAVADEMIAILYATDFATVERKTFLKPSATTAPILNRLGAKYYIGAGSATALSAQLDAHTFDPQESANDLDARLADKLTKTYAQGRPIWLALVLNDRMQVPSLTMELIQQRVPTTIGQFERVIVGTMEEARIFEKP